MWPPYKPPFNGDLEEVYEEKVDKALDYLQNKIMKICCTCKKPFSLEYFHKCRTNPDGYDRRCKICKQDWERKNKWSRIGRTHRSYNKDKMKAIKKAYRQNPETREKYLANRRARYIHSDRKPCMIPNCKNMGERHLPDYNKPSKVIWLCRHHHGLEHSQYTKRNSAIFSPQT